MIIPSLYQEFTYFVVSAGQGKIDWDGAELIKTEDVCGISVTTYSLAADQAGLIGFLRALYNRGIPLISVNLSEHVYKGVSNG